MQAIVREAYSPYIPLIGREPGPMGDDYATLIAEGRVWVATIPDPAGVIVLLPKNDALLLDNIAVSAAARGTGLGGRLMEFAEQQALSQGFDSIRLYTHEKMTTNVDIYLRRGYRETHRATENGFPRVYMEKRLG